VRRVPTAVRAAVAGDKVFIRAVPAAAHGWASLPTDRCPRTLDGLLAGGIAGFVLAVTAHAMGLTSAVARLVGIASPSFGWYLTLGLGVLGGAMYALGGTLAGLDTYATVPPRSLWVGLGYSLLAWLVGVGIGVPLWTQIVLSAEVPMPFVHWLSGLALGAYGAVLGTVYSLVATAGY